MTKPVCILLVGECTPDLEIAQCEARKWLPEATFEIARTASEMQAALEKMTPDAVLVDFALSDFDGTSALDLAKAHDAELPVILWTDAPNEDTAVECMKTGASDYVLKENSKRLGPALAQAVEARHVHFQHQQAEATIRQSEEKYRALFSKMLDGCALHELICDADGNPVDYITLEVNNAFEQLLETKRENVIGIRVSKILPPEELKKWLAIFAPVALEGKQTHYEMYSPLNDKYFEGNCYCPERGKFAVIFTDVTARKHTDRALQESEDKFRNLVEQSSEGISLVDEDGRIIEWNPAREFQTGLLREQVLGKPLWDIQAEILKLHGQSLDNLLQRRTKVLEMLQSGKSPLFHTAIDVTLRDRDGTLHMYQETIFPVQTARGYHIAAITRDVTATRHVELELRKLSRAVEQSPVSIVITDTTGNIDYVNPQFTRVTGYRAEQVIGRNPRFLKSGHTTQAEYKDMWDTITAGNEWHGEFQNRKANGELYWEAAAISPLFNEHGQITHFIGIEDITTRKQVEETLRESEARYRMRTQELELLSALSTQLRHTQSIRDILRETNAHTRIAAQADACGIFLYEPAYYQERCKPLNLKILSQSPRHECERLVPSILLEPNLTERIRGRVLHAPQHTSCEFLKRAEAPVWLARSQGAP